MARMSFTKVVFSIQNIPNKIICSNLKTKFPDFEQEFRNSLTLYRNLEIPWPDTKLPDFSVILTKILFSLTFPWPWQPWPSILLRFWFYYYWPSSLIGILFGFGFTKPLFLTSVTSFSSHLIQWQSQLFSVNYRYMQNLYLPWRDCLGGK